jgi:hypothetical protein
VLEIVLPTPFDGGAITMTYQGAELKSRYQHRIAQKAKAPLRTAVPGTSAAAPAPAPAPPDKPSDEVEEVEPPGGVNAEAAAAPQPGEADAAEEAARMREDDARDAVCQQSLLEYSACFADVETSVGLCTEAWQNYMPVGYGYGKVDHGTRFALVYALYRDDAPSNALFGRASVIHKALRKVGSLPAHLRTQP